MYVVTVEFEVMPGHEEAFRTRMVANARASRETEAGCRQFDVCAVPGQPQRIFLNELYVDRAAFDAHLAAPHFREFDSAVAGWVAGKTVRTYERLEPA